MVRFYIDVSGKDVSRVIAAAGYLSREEQWARFEKAWGATLRDADARHFHATDFWSGRGEFRGWELSGARPITFSKRFTHCAAKHCEYGFAFGVDLEHFETELAGVHAKVKTPHDRLTPSMLCFARILNTAAHFTLRPYGASAAVLIEEGDDTGEIINFAVASEEGRAHT